MGMPSRRTRSDGEDRLCKRTLRADPFAMSFETRGEAKLRIALVAQAAGHRNLGPAGFEPRARICPAAIALRITMSSLSFADAAL
jgi:hypothetical protein